MYYGNVIRLWLFLRIFLMYDSVLLFIAYLACDIMGCVVRPFLIKLCGYPFFGICCISGLFLFSGVLGCC